jgi:biopolymer transport protein ExbD
MTSLIDVVFLLLAFFILAASFAVPAMDVRLSEAKNAAAAKADDRSLTITVNAEGMIFHGPDPINTAELKSILENHPAEAPIYFNVDKDAPFGAFLGVLDEAKSLHRERFMINAKGLSRDGDADAAGRQPGPAAGTSEVSGPAAP